METRAVSVTGPPPGIALHGDEWELILGREMLFAWGLCGSSEGVRLVFEMHRLGAGAEAALEDALAQPRHSWRMGKPLTSGSSRGTRDSWGHKYSKSSRYSCARHSGFFWANLTCYLENSKTNKYAVSILFSPTPPRAQLLLCV